MKLWIPKTIGVLRLHPHQETTHYSVRVYINPISFQLWPLDHLPSSLATRRPSRPVTARRRRGHRARSRAFGSGRPRQPATEPKRTGGRVGGGDAAERWEGGEENDTGKAERCRTGRMRFEVTFLCRSRLISGRRGHGGFDHVMMVRPAIPKGKVQDPEKGLVEPCRSFGNTSETES